jgi:hypothetical protein
MTVGAMDLPPEGMLLDGVALAGDPARGTAPTEGLSLLFTGAGITVRGPQPETERLLPWSGLDTASCRDQVQLPTGGAAAVLLLTSGAQTIQFLLPSEKVSPGQAAYLDQALPAWLARYRGAGAPAGPAVPVVDPGIPTVAAAPAPGPSTGPAGAPAPGPQPTFDPVTGSPVSSAPPAGVGGIFAPGAAEHLSPLPPDERVPPSPGNRRTLILLVALIVVVIGAGAAYFIAKKNNTTTVATTPTTSAVTAPTVGADKVLATGINLRQSDLPAGWTLTTVQPPTSAPATTLTTTPTQKASQQQAYATFATCLGMPEPTVQQLFGSSTQTDESASATSPTFQSPTSPGIQMGSTTTVVKTAADAQADAQPFLRPAFATCFGQFQTASFAAITPGSSAQVTTVTLTAPIGVRVYGYLTTIVLPGQGTRIIGDAFIVGGRIETTIQPTTSGPQVPSDAFTSAYNAVVARVAANDKK